jgi:hypothetical protein
MKLLQINDTEFINKEFVTAVTLSTYYENYFLYIRMSDGNVYETDYFESKEEALSFIELELKG